MVVVWGVGVGLHRCQDEWMAIVAAPSSSTNGCLDALNGSLFFLWNCAGVRSVSIQEIGHRLNDYLTVREGEEEGEEEKGRRGDQGIRCGDAGRWGRHVGGAGHRWSSRD